MSLRDEFQIPQSTWKAMIRRGVISCSVSKQEDILCCLKRKKDSGIMHSEAVKMTAEEMKVSEQWVYEVIRRYH
jgi:hypothetical protein